MHNLEIDETTGAVSYNGRFVGEYNGFTLTLNAGWCRLAGLGFKIEGDTSDRRKVLIDRSDGGKEPEKPAKTPKQVEDPQQESIPMPEQPGSGKSTGTTPADPWERDPAGADF